MAMAKDFRQLIDEIVTAVERRSGEYESARDKAAETLAGLLKSEPMIVPLLDKKAASKAVKAKAKRGR